MDSVLTVQDAVKDYISKGFSVVPVPPRGKGPTEIDWHKRTFEVRSFSSHNVGIILGTRSGGLVDVDLDHALSVMMADDFLPATGMVHGRPGKRRSHRWYRLKDAPGAVTQFRGPKGMLVEIRSGSEKGAQTLVPPSIHPSGERLAWEGHGEPLEVTFAELEPCVRRLAAASLLASVFPTTGRHTFCLALAGVLLRGGMSVEDAETFVYSVARAGGSTDPTARAAVVRSTAEKLATGGVVTGIPSLVKAIPANFLEGVLPSDVVTTAIEHLGFSTNGREGNYTEAEIESFARACGMTRLEYMGSLFVQDARSATMWVRDGLAYTQPMTKQHAKLALEQVLWRYPIERVREDGKAIPVNEVVDRHTALAERVKASFMVQRSEYTWRERQFVERLAPQRDITPAYDPQVAEWLTALGGKDSEKLLDWIASVTRLDEQSAALYLCGEGGAGKGLLAAGLARIWTTGKPVDLAGVMGSFQDALASCPLVFADEALTGQDTSARLRELVGQSGFHLNRKHLTALPVEGALRIMVAGNNDGLLSFKEILTDKDLAALGVRFLKIDVGVEPVRFLESVGGIEVTRSWVAGDKIAAHALWLAQNRAVKRGKRFIVDGNVEDVVNIIKKHGELEQKVLEAVLASLQNPLMPILVKDEEGVWLHSQSIQVHLNDKSSKSLSSREVGTAVKNVSTGKRLKRVVGSYGEINCYQLDLELFKVWCGGALGMDLEEVEGLLVVG